LCAKVSLFFVVASLAGGLVLGVAPATVAAATVIRRWNSGFAVRVFAEGLAVWRTEFIPSQAALLPGYMAAAVLAFNARIFTTIPGARGLGWLSLVGLVFLLGVLVWIAPMNTYYNVKPAKLILFATKFALARPIPTIILLFTGTVLGAATAYLPGLSIISVGGWFLASTYLATRFFDENQDRLASPSHNPSSDRVLGLPTEPLSIH